MARPDGVPFGWNDPFHENYIGEDAIYSAIAEQRVRDAARDLLAALKDIVADPYVERLGSLKLRALAAIARAEGRTSDEVA